MSDPPAPPRRRWFRFSLLNLLLLIAVAFQALVIWRLAPLREENQRLRDEAGYLTVTDRSKVHAIRVKSESPLVWRWKVWVPQGQHVDIRRIVGQIPTADEAWWDHDSGGFVGVGSGEHRLSLRMYSDIDHQWKLEMLLGGLSTEVDLPPDVATAAQHGAVAWQGVGESSAAADDDRRLILCRWRYPSKSELPTEPRSIARIDAEAAGPGWLLWVGPSRY